MAETLNFPFGKAAAVTVAYAAAMAVTIENAMTVITTGSMTGDGTLNLTVSAGVPVGAQLLLIVPASAADNDLTLGTAIDGPNIVGVLGKTKTQGFIYDGTSFKPMGAAVQID